MKITLPQVKAEAVDLLLVKAVANNLEVSHSKAEARDLSIIHINSRTTGLREVHIRATAINTVATANPTSRVINQTCTEVEAVAVVLNKQEDQYQYYTHDQQTEQYGPPCSLCGGFNHSPKHCYKGEHNINNIMEKMSINPHRQQHGNLYQ